MRSTDDFDASFKALTGHGPFPWQQQLYAQWLRDGDPPRVCDIPTGLGKTSVIAVWLLALAQRPEHTPRRLVYIVNRRTVIDQTTEEIRRYRETLTHSPQLSALVGALRAMCAGKYNDNEPPLAISTLRGQFADNREWSADPSRPAVICGTVDMIGSRLLFWGYGLGFRSRPLHAGFLGQDALLVHDEVHLEPAFQQLIEAIKKEQFEKEQTGKLPWPKVSVLALSATARSNKDRQEEESAPFGLTDAERQPPPVIPDPPTEPIHYVWRRLRAKKFLQLHPIADEKELAQKITNLALNHKNTNAAVVVFLRTVTDVTKVGHELSSTKNGVAPSHVRQLTGTMRGHERDELVDDATFKRFLPDPPEDTTHGTVYLVCTSAGEVGVNLSADHLVCDLSTFDSMAQRLGRVNRFGNRNDTRVDVVHPKSFDDKKPNPQREATLALLKQLNGDASSKALGELRADQRLAAFAPEPTILPTTDILFDAWALTTIRDKMPGRPPVAPYLHGVAEWEPPRTSIAWRHEVEHISDELIERYGDKLPQALLDDYPLKTHELLSDRTDRVYSALETLIAKPKQHATLKRKEGPQKDRTAHERTANIWLIEERGSVTVTTLVTLMGGAKQRVIDQLADRIVLLSPSVGGLSAGLLNAESEDADDVADDWHDEHDKPRRQRQFSDEPRPTNGPEGMALIRTIDTEPVADETALPNNESEGKRDSDEVVSSARGRYWHWYARPRDTEDATQASARPVSWEHHTDDVVQRIKEIVKALNLPDDLRQAVILAADLHDLGKKRELWQRSIGNPNPSDWHAKSGKPANGPRWRSRHLSDYRHEFGSLLDVLAVDGGHTATLAELAPEMQDLVLHLIAAHHGYARPSFPPQAYDHERYNTEQNEQAAYDVLRRFARLQRHYGRWGLAYLESLLRAADWSASAKPTEVESDS